MKFNVPRVDNMTSPRGTTVANQFTINVESTYYTRTYFQSYNSIIAIKEYSKNTRRVKIYLDEERWDYSSTTGIYRNMFLGENIKETRLRIESKEYKLMNLNEGRRL